MKNKILCVLGAIILAIIDLFIKFRLIIPMKNVLNNQNSIEIFNGLIKIFYLENRGAAFGILDKNMWFLILVSFAFVFVFVCILFKKKTYDCIFFVSSSLIIGGGLGNLVNRILSGCVIDYIKISFFYSVFNFADCCITLGVMGLLVQMFFVQKDEKNIVKDCKVKGYNARS